MDDYAGRVLADRYRLPLPPSDEYEFAESRAFDTYSGQEVLVRQVPLPEVVEAEVLDADGLPEGFVARDGGARRASARTTRRPTEPAVRRAIEAAQAAAQIPDHPRLDQVFDVFAEGGSLWIVSELVPARPLAALLAEKPLSPYRAAEVASDVLTALRVLHAHGWVHRNITVRTVLVCDDGRVMLTGLAAGAAEEALCGYDPVPAREDADAGPVPGTGADGTGQPGNGPAGRNGPAGHGGPVGADASRGALGPGTRGAPRAAGGRGPGGPASGNGGVPGVAVAASSGADSEAARRAAIEARAEHGTSLPGMPGAAAAGSGPRALEAGGPAAGDGRGAGGPGGPGGDIRAARAGAIAAYRAGARAAARVQEEQRGDRFALPAPRSSEHPGQPDAQVPGNPGPDEAGHGGPPQLPGQGVQRPHTAPPGQIADPYGVGGRGSWHGAQPRAGAVGGDGRQGTLPGGVHGGAVTRSGLPALAPGQQTSAVGQGGGPGVPAQTHGTPRGADADRTPGDGHAQGRSYGTEAGPGQGPQARDVQAGGGGWGELVGAAPSRRGPGTALAAERARQARMAVVGPVTERWAPEQAGPVHENWQLAAPIGPATDLWALGALLFRAVQGHAPYPEENTAELVQLVCAEPPAFAEECGPLRPVVESLLRQDPTERLDFEELRGWLRSLVRSAPEPEAGAHVVAAPPVDPSRLPIVRRRGELVRRRRAGLPATSPHARHKRAKQDRTAKPRRLGRNLLLLVLLLLAAAIAYAMVFMPKADRSGGSASQRTGSAGDVGSPPDTGGDAKASSEPRPDQTSPGTDKSPSGASSSAASQSPDDPDVARGFTLRKDPEGFRVAVASGWDRAPKNGRGQVVYSQGDFELVVVPGRDGTGTYGSDPMTYQRESEKELQPFRDSTWATSSGMRRIDVGGRAMAEGQFTWQDSQGRSLYVRNLAILVGGRYHVVQVRGPEAERDEVTRLYEQASQTYQVTG
ncbi:serine/threonine protein kinase [Streptomyces sp. Tue6028]|uniref:protein kinase n=1 Tax=Streptomyces sp. Tue6028 TaxID=2036037 RepID=UPI000BB37EFD|nr:protein kinase [Streptomyces sp. Tue6028]PBC61715.1 serine/threonine protein kinase [Streptomyces sp. Tue6028]